MYRILRSLDPHHARLGYLGALATVATRGLDTNEALGARFEDLLFERVYDGEPLFEELMARVGVERRPELEKRMIRDSANDPWSAVIGDSSGGRWLYISEFWLHDARMPAALGFLARDQVFRTIDLAKWMQVLLPTLELSEAGYLLQHLITKAAEGAPCGRFNPMLVQASPSLPLLYLRVLLEQETLFPYLLTEFVDRTDSGARVSTRDSDSLLLKATERLMNDVGDVNDPDTALEIRSVSEFHNSLAKKESTRENYLRARMEMLVDLGLVGRAANPSAKKDTFPWRVTQTTRLVAEEWRALAGAHRLTADHLDKAYFAASARIFEKKLVQVTRLEERLLWVAKAFAELGREFGFTPGRTLALKASFLAWESGRCLEIADSFDSVYKAASSEWNRFFHFSGGSRFDREFLIRIDPEIIPALESSLDQEQPRD